MTRPGPDERRRQIIDGALQVFSTRGFAQATNKEIAAAARINSAGLIYHYFQDKADLLRAVLERHAPPIQLALHPETLFALPPEEALARIGLAYVGLLEAPATRAFFKLVLGEALRDPAFARTLGAIGPQRVLHLLTEYLRLQMEGGRLRPVEPSLAARSFLGPLIARLMLHDIFQIADPQETSAPEWVAAQVDLFLRGLEPQRETRP